MFANKKINPTNKKIKAGSYSVTTLVFIKNNVGLLNDYLTYFVQIFVECLIFFMNTAVHIFLKLHTHVQTNINM